MRARPYATGTGSKARLTSVHARTVAQPPPYDVRAPTGWGQASALWIDWPCACCYATPAGHCSSRATT